jgi:hypothetical protein
VSSADLSPLTYFFMIAGPTSAAILSFVFSIWYQNRKQKMDTKRNLFMTLIIHRQPGMHIYEAVNALNAIDVVFDDSPEIVDLWHRYYGDLCQPTVNRAIASHDYLDLLSEMAKSLGYKSVSQTDMDKCYTPRCHVELAKQSEDIQREWLRVLENTARFVVDKKDAEKIAS